MSPRTRRASLLVLSLALLSMGLGPLASAAAPRADGTAGGEADDFLLSFTVFAPGAQDSFGIGVSESATTGYDSGLDRPEPPTPPGPPYVQAYVYDAQANASYLRRLNVSILPATGWANWTIAIDRDGDAGVVEIRWNPDHVPVVGPQQRLRLFDARANVEFDLAGRANYTFDVADGFVSRAIRLSLVTVAPAGDVTSPVISAVSPTGTTPDARPAISASYSDDVGVDVTNVALALDGAAVAALVTADGLSFTPSADLASGEHAVNLTVADAAGNRAYRNWTFTVPAPSSQPPPSSGGSTSEPADPSPASSSTTTTTTTTTSPTPESSTSTSPTPASPTPAPATPESPAPTSPTPTSPTPASPTPASPTPTSPTPASPTPATPSPTPASRSTPTPPTGVSPISAVPVPATAEEPATTAPSRSTDPLAPAATTPASAKADRTENGIPGVGAVALAAVAAVATLIRRR